MIYINNITQSQNIALPLYTKTGGNVFDLYVKRSTTTAGSYVNIPITYVSQDRLFVNVSVVLPTGMADGEYEYRLRENGQIVGGGILSITGVKYADIQHEQQITYKEYESNQI